MCLKEEIFSEIFSDLFLYISYKKEFLLNCVEFSEKK